MAKKQVKNTAILKSFFHRAGLDSIKSKFNTGIRLGRKRYTKSLSYSKKHPFTAFFASLVMLFIIILLGSFVFQKKPIEEVVRTETKEVKIFELGKVPTLAVQGKVTKSGVIKIIAQTPGIVSQVNTLEGEQVWKGKTLVNLSSNYQGGNAFSLQRQLASLQYQNTKDTYDTQKGLLQRQRDLVNRQNENSDELRKITLTSIEDTQALTNLNSTILSSIKSNIQDLESNNTGGVNDQAILGLQQLQSQFQSGTNQLNSSLRTTQYLVNNDKPARDLEKITKDMALAQIDVQEKALKLGFDAAGIQLKLALVQESLMFPTAPFKGTIQKIHVKVGDSVSPGTPLITISGQDETIIVEVQVTEKIAASLNQTITATINSKNKSIDATPSFISTEATSGQLYSVIFYLDKKYSNLFTDSEYVTLIIPIGVAESTDSPIFIPVDAVFQTQDEAFVFVVHNNKVLTKPVTLGGVVGEYVVVEKGLSFKDQIILNRNVSEGENITVQK